MTSFLVRTLLTAVALWITSLVVPGIHVGDTSGGRAITLIVVAVVFGVVNALLKPLVTLLSLPFIIVTLGLFSLVVNALMLWVTSGLSGALGLDFHVDSFFWAAVLGALVLAIVSMLLEVLVPERRPAAY